MVIVYTTAQVHQYFEREKKVTTARNSSDYISTGVLSQWDATGTFHLVQYILEIHTLAEGNYDIYNKKLMAIIEALKNWRTECEEALNLPHLMTNIENFQYFI